MAYRGKKKKQQKLPLTTQRGISPPCQENAGEENTGFPNWTALPWWGAKDRRLHQDVGPPRRWRAGGETKRSYRALSAGRLGPSPDRHFVVPSTSGNLTINSSTCTTAPGPRVPTGGTVPCARSAGRSR